MNDTIFYSDYDINTRKFSNWILAGICACAIIGGLGVFANAAVVFLSYKHVRQHSYVLFVGNLALADILIGINGIVLMPVGSVDENFCLASLIAAIVGMGVAVTSQPLLGINRYVAIKKATWYKPIFENLPVVSCILLFSWVMPGGFAAADLYNGCMEVSPNRTVCLINYGETAARICPLTKIVHFLTCYAVLCFCYTKIYLCLRRHQKQLLSSGLVQSCTESDERQLLNLMAMHAVAPIFIQLPALGVVTLYPRALFEYPQVGYTIVTMFLLEPLVNAILSLVIVKIFRRDVGEALRQIRKFICSYAESTTFQTEVIALPNSESTQGRNSKLQTL